MGLFDTFHGKYKCKHCKLLFKFEEQTKDYERHLEDFYLGDYIDRGNRDYFYDFEYQCPNCGTINKISIAVRRGQYVGVYASERTEYINILDLDNIEDGFLRNRKYSQGKIGAHKKLEERIIESGVPLELSQELEYGRYNEEKTSKRQEQQDLEQKKRDYIAKVHNEMKRRGFTSKEIQAIIDKTGFLSALEEYPEEQLHYDVSATVNEIIMTAVKSYVNDTI